MLRFSLKFLKHHFLPEKENQKNQMHFVVGVFSCIWYFPSFKLTLDKLWSEKLFQDEGYKKFHHQKWH